MPIFHSMFCITLSKPIAAGQPKTFKDHFQVSLSILSEFKGIN